MGYLEDQTNKINAEYDANYAKRKNEIDHQKWDTQDQLYKDYETRKKDFQKQSADVDTQAAVSRRNNNELMASLGAYNSGDNITANSRIDNSRANDLRAIMNSRNEYKRLRDEKVADAQLNAERELSDWVATNNANRLSALRQVQESERQREFQEKMQKEQLAAQERIAAANRQASVQKAQQTQANSIEKAKQNYWNDFNKAITVTSDDEKDDNSRQKRYEQSEAAFNQLQADKEMIKKNFGDDFWVALSNAYYNQADRTDIF